MRLVFERKSDPQLQVSEHRSFAFQLKATGDDGAVEGYGSVFNNVDSYGDIILPGAFMASLEGHKAAGTMPAMLWQHRADEPIGKWTEMVEDERGLMVRGRLALDTMRGREAHSLLKMGALNGLSIGFITKNSTYDRGNDLRTITEIDLWEVSLVTFPANGAARVTGVKSDDFAACTTFRDIERRLVEAGMKKHLAAAGIAAVKRVAAAEREARAELQRANDAARRLLATLKA